MIAKQTFHMGKNTVMNEDYWIYNRFSLASCFPEGVWAFVGFLQLKPKVKEEMSFLNWLDFRSYSYCWSIWVCIDLFYLKIASYNTLLTSTVPQSLLPPINSLSLSHLNSLLVLSIFFYSACTWKHIFIIFWAFPFSAWDLVIALTPSHFIAVL